MRILKLILLAVLSLALCLFAAACGSEDKTEQGGGGNKEFEGIVFEDAEFVYDGKPKTIKPSNFPMTASISYSENAVQTDVGAYQIWATVSAPGYNPKTVSATLTIKKAVYDMSGVSFTNKTVAYNGEVQSIEIKGKLPEGVTVSYIGSGTDIGVYDITASFKGDERNYEPIPNMTAKLTVKDLDLSKITFDGAEFTYDGEKKFVEVGGMLPEGAEIVYEGNGVTDAGSYQVKATVTLKGNVIFEKTVTVTVKKAKVDMSSVMFTGRTVTYNGQTQSIEITGTLPKGVEVTYSGGGVEIGTYDVTAKFKVDEKNYEPISDMTATLVIVAEGEEKFTVEIVVSDPNGVTGTTSLQVKKGESAVFDITVKSTYDFVSVSKGSYNAERGELVIEKVSDNISVSFTVRALGYDKNDTVCLDLQFTEYDTSDVKSGRTINLGTKATLTAGDKTRKFLGWSLGASLVNGGKLLSTDEIFVLSVEPSVIGTNTGNVSIYSNYADKGIVKYDANGGSVNTSSTNMKGNSYYSAIHMNGVVTVNLSKSYTDFAQSASTFWDDGTFYRDGYVLIEYNTKPDGTGEAYSLGSKFYSPSVASQTLYCIWAKASEGFEYTDVRWGYASGVTATTAPHWKIDGIKITKYNGNDRVVVIPEMIDGKYVTTIDKDAFVGKDVEVIVFNKYILRVEDGAFVSCPNLTTIYMNDSIFYMNDAAFDAESLAGIKNFYLNATMAPRFMKNRHGDGGVFSVKFSRLLASQDKNRIIVVSGSSTYQGLGSAYLEALFGGEYTVVNLGTTRTGTGLIFFEALQHYIHEGDIVIYAPENHINMFGQNEMLYRSFYDLEGMYNLYRYIDISHYPSVFSALSAYNRERRYTKAPTAYEDIAGANINSDKYGDYQNASRGQLREDSSVKYIDSYFITLNKYYKNDLGWDDIPYQTENKDYLTSPTWTDFTIYKDEINRAIRLLQATGAKVYFGFAPVDADDVVPEAQNREWMEAYDALITENYEFDGLVGSSADYVFAHNYFYDCAYHVNDYGRTYRTYQMYLDLCEILGIEDMKAIDGVGTDFAGCLFEDGSDGTPVHKVDYLN